MISVLNQIKRSRSVLLFVLFTTLALPGCEQKSTSSAKKPRAPTVHRVDATQVKVTHIGNHHYLVGTLKYRQKVRIHNQEKGRIVSLEHFEGDLVNANELLVKLDDTALKAELQKTRALSKQAQLDLKRIRRLNLKKAASEEVLARKATDLEIARAEVLILETRQSHTLIKAPFAGVITRRLQEPGDIAMENTHIMTLAKPDSLIVEASVSEQLLPHLTLGHEVDVTIDVLPDIKFPGQIVRIHPQLDTLTHYGTIEVKLDNLPVAAKAGYSAHIDLDSQIKDRLLVPVQAIRREQLNEIVYLLKDNVAHQRMVKTGKLFDNWQEITAGISAGDLIVSKGFLGLTDKMTVSINKKDGDSLKN